MTQMTCLHLIFLSFLENKLVSSISTLYPSPYFCDSIFMYVNLTQRIPG